MKIKKEDGSRKAEARTATRITSFAQLAASIESTIECPYMLDGNAFVLDVVREKDAVADRVRAIQRAVQPPWVEARKDYNPLDPGYLKARDEAEDTARCVRVYFCCPVIAAQKPGLATDKDITAFIKEAIPRHLQELIAVTAQLGGLSRVAEASNFTDTPGSAGS